MDRVLRSSAWYSGDDRNAYIHRAWMRRGVPDSAFTGRPQIAIANTASDLTPCNAHLTEVAQSVKNGIYEAGGIPLELPVVSLGETQVRPTAMLWRNMAAMSCTSNWSSSSRAAIHKYLASDNCPCPKIALACVSNSCGRRSSL